MESFELKKPQKKEVEQFYDAFQKVKASEIFDADYLDNSKVVIFGKRSFVCEQNNSRPMINEEFVDDDFLFGKRTDFIAVTEKNEYENYTIEKLDDRQFIVFYFFNKKPSFEEFIVHEAAHNVFDIEYKKRFGEYEEKGNLTEVSEDYGNKMKKYIIELIKKYYPNMDVEKFNFIRQPICEIYALLYEREFCKKIGINTELHDQVEKNVQTFINDPVNELKKFNAKYDRNCSMEDFFKESHILSLIVAPLVERECPDFKDRLKVFWQ